MVRGELEDFPYGTDHHSRNEGGKRHKQSQQETGTWRISAKNLNRYGIQNLISLVK